MNKINTTNNEINSFLIMYQSIINFCGTKKRKYNVSLYYINNQLYFNIIDKETSYVLYKDYLNCSEETAKELCDIITLDFITTHDIRYAAYQNPTNDDIEEYYRLSNTLYQFTFHNREFYFKNKPMKIHRLENSIFTINIYLLNGIDDKTELLHKQAFDKANKTYLLTKKNQ